ncbi:hypothetical protein AVEN_39147-1 [Araneus ventricosus]|uniref:Uncharacterized protein n=1 Tax=Araneus ventricosus TaxID=182803 RepID=A0A4Y2PEZ9_ARAVE|nr:hypothetical protein AVEN_39147-1 [Araneus ventricosus]
MEMKLSRSASLVLHACPQPATQHTTPTDDNKNNELHNLSLPKEDYADVFRLLNHLKSIIQVSPTDDNQNNELHNLSLAKKDYADVFRLLNHLKSIIQVSPTDKARQRTSQPQPPKTTLMFSGN